MCVLFHDPRKAREDMASVEGVSRVACVRSMRLRLLALVLSI